PKVKISLPMHKRCQLYIPDIHPDASKPKHPDIHPQKNRTRNQPTVKNPRQPKQGAASYCCYEN
ncbi:hypothetical protein Ancab_028882, partial [Ancistrocladus abbreviatus]